MYSVRPVTETVYEPPRSESEMIDIRPTREEVQRELEAIVVANAGTPQKPTPEDIQKEMEVLMTQSANQETGTPTRSSEDVQRELEELTPQ